MILVEIKIFNINYVQKTKIIKFDGITCPVGVGFFVSPYT